MQLLKRAGILCLFSFFQALGAQANPLWFADRGGLHQIDLATNAISLDLPLPENAIAIPVDPSDSSAWAVTGNTVSKFSTAGGTQFQLVLQNLGKDVGTAKVAVLDTLSGNLWIAGDKQLLLLGPGGQLLASPLVPDSVQALAVDTDRSLWVLGTSTLFQYSSAAQLIAQWGLAPPLQQSKFLALDGNAGVLWLGGSKQVVKLALNQPQTTLLTIATSEVVSSMALDSLSHALWVSGAQNLFRYDPNGNLRTTTGLRPDKITQPTDLAFDFPTQSLWLGHVGGLSRFSAQGAYVLTIPVKTQVDAVGKTLIGLPTPSVRLVSPAPGSVANNSQPRIRLGYDALCGVSSCGFPNSYFSAWQLSAQLNGQDVSSLFSFDSTLGGVIYTPSVRLPEGTNNLSARVTDSIGQVSSPLNATFMIDTIAPQFLSISPPSGTAFDVPQMTLQGRVDDAQATISVSAATVAASATGPNFSFPFSLLPGSNPLTLSAKDTAGNQTSVLLNYLYQPFTVAINSPTANAVIDNNVVTVTGTFGTAQGVTVTVNGVAADVTGNSFSASNVPLAFGTNTLTVTAKTGSGATATQTVNVSSTFPAIHIDNPSAGAAFNTDRILVSGTVQGPPNSAVSVNGVVAAVSGTQFFAGNVPLDTGTAAITALVTSPTGKRASQGINVSSTGRGPVSITATPTQGIAPLIVVFNATSTGNRLVSWQANPGGPGSFDTSDPSVLFKFAYSQPGSYQAIVTVTDSTGQPYTQTLVIDVASLAQMDQTFKAIWNGMNNALLAGDKAGAMSYLTRSAKNKYGPAFDVLLPYMTGIIGSYSPLKRASISGDIGEYAVIRNDGGVNRLYFIYFSRDGDGIWRIDSM